MEKNKENKKDMAAVATTNSFDSFIKIIEPYCLEPCPAQVRLGKSISYVFYLKPEFKNNRPQKLDEAAYNIGANRQGFGFTIDVKSFENEDEVQLTQSEIENGGPQPRLTVDDNYIPLGEQIRADKEQKTPIDCYPSPLKNGKYRIYDGHTRYKAIFTYLEWPTIKAKIHHNMTEEEAWRNSIISNVSQKTLKPFDLGKALYEAKQKFPEIYPTQEALAKNFPCLMEDGIDRSRISQLIADYRLKVDAIPKIDPKLVTSVTKISEKVTREIHKVPESARPFILEEIATKNLNPDQTKTIAKKLEEIAENQQPILKETVTQTVHDILALNQNKLEQDTNKKVLEINEQTDPFLKKKIDTFDKMVEKASAQFPEKITRQVIDALFRKGHIPLEKSELNRCLTVIAETLLNKAQSDGILEAVIQQVTA